MTTSLFRDTTDFCHSLFAMTKRPAFSKFGTALNIQKVLKLKCTSKVTSKLKNDASEIGRALKRSVRKEMARDHGSTCSTKLWMHFGKLGELSANRDLKQTRTATAVNKQLNFTVKNKPHTNNYIYCIFEAYFMIKSL